MVWCAAGAGVVGARQASRPRPPLHAAVAQRWANSRGRALEQGCLAHLQHAGGCQRGVGHLQRHHGEGHTRLKHQARRLWVRLRRLVHKGVRHAWAGSGAGRRHGPILHSGAPCGLPKHRAALRSPCPSHARLDVEFHHCKAGKANYMLACCRCMACAAGQGGAPWSKAQPACSTCPAAPAPVLPTPRQPPMITTCSSRAAVGVACCVKCCARETAEAAARRWRVSVWLFTTICTAAAAARHHTA